jgi:hypothetical protein
MTGGGGRNDFVTAEALTAMAQVLAEAQENARHGHHDHGEVEERRLDRFV